MERMTAQHIAAGGGAFEPQRKNNFMLRVTPRGAAATGTDVIELSLFSFPFPKIETEANAINYLNEQRKFPGRTTFPNMPLSLKDYVDQGTAEKLYAWSRLVFDPDTGEVGLCAEIKAQATLILFAPNGSMERKWKLLGLWPRKIDMGDGTMDDSKENMVTMEFAVDLVVPG